MKCVDCGRKITPQKRAHEGHPRHAGRGLCTACHARHKAHGTLIDFERKSWSREELLNEWVLLRDEGIRMRDAAPRIGVSYDALDRALCRALARGDDRGMRHAFARAS